MLFFSSIGFIVNSLILAFSVAQRWRHGAPPHGNPLALTAQEGNFLIWAVLGGIGRLAALNLGQAAREITARRVVVVCLWVIGLAATIPCQLLLTNVLSATSPTDLANAARFAKWIGGPLLLAIGLFLLARVVLFFIRLYAGVWREIKVKTEESANSDGLPAVEAWLRLLDGGNYAQTWETAAASFQRTTGKEQWVGQMKQMRRPLGKVLSRKLSPPQFKSGLTQFGASFVFASSFEELLAATETVTFTRQRPNGEWKAVGYLVQPAGDDQEPSQPSDSHAGDLKTQVATIANAGSAIAPEFAPAVAPGKRPFRWSWLGLVIGPLVALAVVSVMLNVPPRPAAVVDVLPASSDNPPGLIGWHWNRAIPRAVSFGPETERTLLFNTNGTTDYLGLASNQMVKFPTATKPPGGIAFVEDAETSAILMGSGWGTLILPLSRQQWDRLTAAKCVEKVAATTNLRSTAMARKADLPATYLFRTDPGLIGMLNIASLPNGENGVGIRYKLVTESSTNALFPAPEVGPAGRPNGSKPIPQQAVQLFNQSRDLQALMIPLYQSQAASSRVQAARLVMQLEEIQSKLILLTKGTPVEGVRWDQARLSRQREQVDWSKDQDKWRQLTTAMGIAQFNEERLMVGAGAADFLPPQANQLQFGEWIETTLPHPSAGKDCCLDFDSGQLLTPPPAILAAMPAKPKPGKDVIEAMPEELGWGALRSATKETNAVVRWILESGVGAAEMAPHRLIVFCPVRTISPIADPVLNPDWEQQVTPAWLLWKLHLTEKHANAQPVPANAMEFLTFPSGPFSSTNSLCLFRTRARAMGLLQITGFTDHPPGVKIRYKLVRSRNI